MAPLITLLVGSFAARLVGWLGVDYVDSWARAIGVGLAAMFFVTGAAHFVPPLRSQLIAIVPRHCRRRDCWSASPAYWSCWVPWACCFPPPASPRRSACCC